MREQILLPSKSHHVPLRSSLNRMFIVFYETATELLWVGHRESPRRIAITMLTDTKFWNTLFSCNSIPNYGFGFFSRSFSCEVEIEMRQSLFVRGLLFIEHMISIDSISVNNRLRPDLDGSN